MRKEQATRAPVRIYHCDSSFRSHSPLPVGTIKHWCLTAPSDVWQCKNEVSVFISINTRLWQRTHTNKYYAVRHGISCCSLSVSLQVNVQWGCFKCHSCLAPTIPNTHAHWLTSTKTSKHRKKATKQKKQPFNLIYTWFVLEYMTSFLQHLKEPQR